MFSNPVYNLPPQFNENLLSQNLAGLSLNTVPTQLNQQQQQQRNIDFESFQFPQQVPIDIGSYAPPELADSDAKWPAPEDVDNSYQRGSTMIRQYNNSMIDDYYKKFLRPITDYIAIPTNGQPTYVYQNLGLTATTNAAATATATTGLSQQPPTGSTYR